MFLFSNYYYYRYPQFIWAQEINKIFKSDIISNLHDRDIIDAPCGDGIISFWIKKNYKNNISLYDIDKTRILIAQKNIKDTAIFEENIFKMNLKTKNNIWLFINSLYCMQDKQDLLKNMSAQIEYIIAVFPYINHINYKTFVQQNPSFINHSEMNKDQTINFFKEFHYEMVFNKDVTFIPFYKKSIPYFKSLINIFNILFDRFNKNKSGAYWIGVFKKY